MFETGVDEMSWDDTVREDRKSLHELYPFCTLSIRQHTMYIGMFTRVTPSYFWQMYSSSHSDIARRTTELLPHLFSTSITTTRHIFVFRQPCRLFLQEIYHLVGSHQIKENLYDDDGLMMVRHLTRIFC